uniref:Uncharacterized protein n=1 Tax=Glossina pallidipes TaxID=7398 RepID=A0A1B0A0Z9_GLOPL
MENLQPLGIYNLNFGVKIPTRPMFRSKELVCFHPCHLWAYQAINPITSPLRIFVYEKFLVNISTSISFNGTGSDFNCTEGKSCTTLRTYMLQLTRAYILTNENEFHMKYEINFNETDISSETDFVNRGQFKGLNLSALIVVKKL